MHKSYDGFGLIELLVVLVVVGAISGVGLFVWHARMVTGTQPAATGQSVSNANTKTVSIDGTYATYFNYDTGIRITYSKYVANAAQCTGTAPEIDAKYVATPVKVYEDTAEHKVYVAASKYVTMKSHELSPGTYQGYDSCVVSSTTLTALLHPVDDLVTNTRLVSTEFDYGNVASVDGLDAFAAAHAPEGIVIDHTVAPTKDGNLYSYTFKLVGTQEDGPQPRWYSLRYDPVKKLAVFWVTPNTQSPSWVGIDASGAFTLIDTPTASIID